MLFCCCEKDCLCCISVPSPLSPIRGHNHGRVEMITPNTVYHLEMCVWRRRKCCCVHQSLPRLVRLSACGNKSWEPDRLMLPHGWKASLIGCYYRRFAILEKKDVPSTTFWNVVSAKEQRTNMRNWKLCMFLMWRLFFRLFYSVAKSLLELLPGSAVL